MLSIILYGRNDHHGYNYHKRATISINGLAAILTNPTDEIIFIDYNTPDDMPTLVESIYDTLTQSSKAKLKIYRLRPQQHKKFSKKASRQVLEALARNIAIRRSNPRNKWILSTNSDMVFLPKNNMSLSEIVANLAPGFYTLPRFELPEYFWDAYLHRLQPKENILFLQQHAVNLHLPMCVFDKPFIQFENVGDFQLMLREDIFRIGGFNEYMSSAWHIDANLCKRMFLLYGKIESLADSLEGYHCNHIRAQETDMHGKFHVENSWKKFVTNITSPYVSYPHAWGLADESIEHILLPNKAHLQTLTTIQGTTPYLPYTLTLMHEHFNRPTYPTAHVFPFLVDHLANLAKNARITYIGFNTLLIRKLNAYLQARGFTHALYLPNPQACFYLESEVFIFDFGLDITENSPALQRKKQQQAVMKCFFTTVKRTKNLACSPKFLGIHTAYTPFRYIFKMKIRMSDPGYNTNICYGFIEKKNNFAFLKFKPTFMLKRIKLCMQYCCVRYGLTFNDKIISFMLKTKLAKYFLKS